MIDLHYWPTPNGFKITIMLEECGLPYKIIPVNIGTGEQERVTLTETAVNTGVFAGTLSTSTEQTAAASNNGVLRAVFGNRMQVDYTDPVTGFTFDNPALPGTVSPYGTGNANRDTAAMVKIKSLYLSATADLDRLDPVATGDLTLSQSAAVAPATSSTPMASATYTEADPRSGSMTTSTIGAEASMSPPMNLE